MAVGTTGGGMQDFSSMPFGWGHVDEATKWFKQNSNISEWWDNLSPEQRSIIEIFTAAGYGSINDNQYNVPWEDMDEWNRDRVARLYDALNSFQLNTTIRVNRQADFQIFGSDSSMSVAQVKQFLRQSDGYVQNDGFMSFSTKPNGVEVDGSGLILHVKFPPSVGAGAYVAPHSSHPNESEWLANSNGVYKFDLNKVHEDYEGVHVYGEWVGQNRAQTISKTYNQKALTNKRNQQRKKK